MARVEYGRYRVTWVNSAPHATWSYNDPETGEYKRRRHALDCAPNATTAELRAALIAFAGRQEREEMASKVGTVADYLDAYAAHRERDGKIMRPIVSNIRVLKPFFGKMRPEDITDEVCRAYTKERHDAGCSGSTIVTELGRLSSALKWAVQYRLLAADKLPIMWFPHRSEAKDRVLSREECARLIEAATGHVRLFVLLCLMTGARTSAVLELTWDRVNFETDEIDLRAPRQVDILRKKTQKGRSVVHMTGPLKVYLLDARRTAQTGHVIEFREQRVHSIKTAFGRARRKAGLEDGVSPHTLRHTFATMAQQGRVPAEDIAKAMGHKNANTTRRNYLHAGAELTKGATDAVAAQLGAKVKVVKG